MAIDHVLDVHAAGFGENALRAEKLLHSDDVKSLAGAEAGRWGHELTLESEHEAARLTLA